MEVISVYGGGEGGLCLGRFVLLLVEHRLKLTAEQINKMHARWKSIWCALFFFSLSLSVALESVLVQVNLTGAIQLLLFIIFNYVGFCFYL